VSTRFLTVILKAACHLCAVIVFIWLAPWPSHWNKFV